jgi:uncharacterized protein (DUF488 family)
MAPPGVARAPWLLAMTARLLTVGHGTATEGELTRLLVDAGVRQLVDVRRFPGSRAHPYVARAALELSMPAAGITYRWDERLGGRRRGSTEPLDHWWQVAAFRAYAEHMRSDEFVAGIDDLVADVRTTPTAIMCSESLWWRCHRRLIADHLVLVRGVAVSHLDHRGALTEHRVAAGARVSSSNLLIYDVQ